MSAAVRSIFEQAMNTAAPRSTHDPRTPSNDNAPEHDVFDGVLSVEDAAALLHVGRNTIYGLVAQNKIPHRRLGKAIRFSRVALMAWLASWSVQGAKEGK